MTYIILAAGVGTRLHPLTLNQPKSLYKLDKNMTVLRRMAKLIRKNDINAEIVVVTGFMEDSLEKELSEENIIFVKNPFYAVTNSIASLWFAKEFLERDNVVVINGDIVLENKLMEDVVCVPTEKPYVLIDTSCQDAGDYNVQVKEGKVLVMSKQLTSFSGEYACLTKLDSISSRLLKQEINDMIKQEMYDQYFENALVQMIFSHGFELYYLDIVDYQWTEVDCVDDLLKAKEIHTSDF
jgi:choline kinase